MAVDVLMALAIVSALAITLSAVVYRQRAAEAGLNDSRSAVYLAEHALLNLQHDQPLPALNRDTTLKIIPVINGEAPAGFVWVDARAAVHGHERSLLGIVPASAIHTAGANP